MNTKHKVSGAGLAIGLGLMGLAAIIGVDTANVQVPPTYSRVGPQAFPYAIALGLGLCGMRIAWEAWRDPASAHTPPFTDWKSVAIIALAFVAQAYILKPLGFVISALILFFSITIAFGSRKYARDLVIGLILVLVAYVGFTRALGIQLPPGLLKGIL